MQKFLILGFALALMMVPVAGHAQTATDDGEGDGESSAPANDLSLGTTDGENQVGTTYIKESHGDWQVRCIRAKEGQDPCQLYQLMVDGNGTAVAEINMFLVPESDKVAGGAAIITPLETLLTANLRMGVDSGEVKVYPFAFCRTIGCFSRIGLTDPEIAAFKRGAAARVTIVPAAAPDQKVELSASLTGFTAGWNALIALGEEAAE